MRQQIYAYQQTEQLFCPQRGENSHILACAFCKVRHTAICGALNDEELKDLGRISRNVTIEAGHDIVIEGDPVKYVYNLVAGSVKLYKSLPDGRTQIAGFLLPGDFFGLPARAEHNCSIAAIERSELCQFPRAGLERTFDKYERLDERFLSSISDELAAAQDHMLLLGRKTALERIASFLVSFSERRGRLGSDRYVLDLPMRRGDLASYLGLTVETVSRMFTQLKELGVLSTPAPRQAVILNADYLQHLADGDEA